MSSVEIAKRVLQEEAEAILQVRKEIDISFDNAIRMILASQGRIILTGMGKSGHVARKVAATMASTGTPAFYLHPAEAVHGDLGMVTPDDVVVAYSYSGETGEILRILPAVKRIGAGLIAITGQRGSTLSKNADICLSGKVEKEADTLGLAPTNSTTAALALGDALAVALMETRKFTESEFAVFHPGGSLGRKLLLTVEQVMHKGNDNPIISEKATIKDALFVMTDKGLGAVSIIGEDGCLLGIMTDGDVRRGLEKGAGFLTETVTEAMTRNPLVISPDKLAAEALHFMEKHEPRPITVLPVVDEQYRAVGMVHITDLLKQGVV